MATLTGLNTFTAGTPAQASQVNTNFGLVKTFAEALSTGVNIDAGSISNSKLATGAVTSDKILDNTIVLADLAVALQNFLVPVGTIAATARTTAPAGWLLCDGTSTSGYTTLASLVGATTPDMRGRFPLGDNSALTLLAAGGSTTITEANLPAHAHGTTASLNSGTVTVDGGGGHGHTASSVGAGGHSHTLNATYIGPSASAHAHNLLADYVATGTAGASTLGSGLGNAVQAVGDHTHGVTVDAVGNHAHTALVGTAITVTNPSVGSGTAYLQPHIVVNYIIKHD